jgi:hypothetical protein
MTVITIQIIQTSLERYATDVQRLANWQKPLTAAGLGARAGVGLSA